MQFVEAKWIVNSILSLSENEKDWEDMLESDDKDSSKSVGKPRVTITATSIIPNFSEASVTEINACLSNYTSFSDPVTKNKTVTELQNHT